MILECSFKGFTQGNEKLLKNFSKWNNSKIFICRQHGGDQNGGSKNHVVDYCGSSDKRWWWSGFRVHGNGVERNYRFKNVLGS